MKKIILIFILILISTNLFAQPIAWDELKAKKGYHSLDAAVNNEDDCYKLYYTSRNMLYIPDEISELENLQILDFSNNFIEHITSRISRLQNLQKLYLKNNRIEKLPEEIGQLQNLIELDLSGNKIESLPESINNLKNLTIFYLSGNPIDELEVEELRKSLPNCEIIF